jgi:hypothetical protein
MYCKETLMSKYTSVGHGLTIDGETIFGVIVNVAEDFEFTNEQLLTAIRKGSTVSMAPIVKKEAKTSIIASLNK